MASNTELTSSEKDLFKHTVDRNYEEVKRLLTVEKVSVNCLDEDGMTPLQHAAFKGDYNLCKLFLDCGANVNLCRQTTQYSALTFAGLSGKGDVASLLLEHGASITKVNSINKTAAQMAAFVGNHNVANIINNFIPFQEIDYFTEIYSAHQKEPKLPKHLATPVHKMAIKTNIHPVCLIMYIQENMCILDNSKQVIEVFDILSEKKMKMDENELLSLKFHHIAFIIHACQSFVFEEKMKCVECKNVDLKRTGCRNTDTCDILNRLIKHWIKQDENGFPMVLEKLLRKDINEYENNDCGLFRQLVRTLAPVKIGEEPSAITIINDVVNGQGGIKNSKLCATCGEPSAEKKCSACKSVYYCDKNCQKLHWFSHKLMCEKLMKSYNEKNLEAKEDDDSK